MYKVSIMQSCVLAVILLVIIIICFASKPKKKSNTNSTITENDKNVVTQITLSAKNTKGCIGFIEIGEQINYNIMTRNGRNDGFFYYKKDIQFLFSLSRKDICLILFYLIYVKLDLEKRDAKRALKYTKIKIFKRLESKKIDNEK